MEVRVRRGGAVRVVCGVEGWWVVELHVRQRTVKKGGHGGDEVRDEAHGGCWREGKALTTSFTPCVGSADEFVLDGNDKQRTGVILTIMCNSPTWQFCPLLTHSSRRCASGRPQM